MKIRCEECGYLEETTVSLFVKIIGGAMPVGGYWAWTAYLFAGTGFALPIVVAIITGGVGILIFKEEIVQWIISKGYKCPKCGAGKWGAVSDEVAEELSKKESHISDLEVENLRFKQEASKLRDELNKKDVDLTSFINKQNSSFSMEDIEELITQLEEKDSKIEELLKDNDDWKAQKDAFLAAQEKAISLFRKRFKSMYSSLEITDKALRTIVRLNDEAQIKLEQQFMLLQLSPQRASFRDNIHGADVKEIGFGTSGRLYIRKKGNIFTVVVVGDKNSQDLDIKYLKQAHKNH
ncbi:hypothetical protein [Thiofilum flexile]|uniref:hypothetical protein n=1 Tax=Thiofilum flexile TaxID=125627 RepID=UPI000375A121|nr:hypothetical protein [Thiofilum flexile]